MKKIKKTLLTLLTIFIVTSLFGCNSIQKDKSIKENSNTHGNEDNKVVELKQEEVDEEDSNLTLVISNQSFYKRIVQIKVDIDDKTAVNKAFDVKEQHNWLFFNYKLSKGKHIIEAIAEDGAAIREVFEIKNDEKKWILIDYWNQDGKKTKLSYSIDTKPFTLR